MRLLRVYNDLVVLIFDLLNCFLRMVRPGVLGRYDIHPIIIFLKEFSLFLLRGLALPAILGTIDVRILPSKVIEIV